ncbi:hypothetical protein ACTFIV_004052 [Dictyostelium citrinum]
MEKEILIFKDRNNELNYNKNLNYRRILFPRRIKYLKTNYHFINLNNFNSIPSRPRKITILELSISIINPNDSSDLLVYYQNYYDYKGEYAKSISRYFNPPLIRIIGKTITIIKVKFLKFQSGIDISSETVINNRLFRF